jgi:hypothetical protein
MSMLSSLYWVSILAGLVGFAFNAGVEFDAWQRGDVSYAHPFMFFSSAVAVVALLLSLFDLARRRAHPAFYDEPFRPRDDDASLPSA